MRLTHGAPNDSTGDASTRKLAVVDQPADCGDGDGDGDGGGVGDGGVGAASRHVPRDASVDGASAPQERMHDAGTVNVHESAVLTQEVPVASGAPGTGGSCEPKRQCMERMRAGSHPETPQPLAAPTAAKMNASGSPTPGGPVGGNHAAVSQHSSVPATSLSSSSVSYTHLTLPTKA